MSIVDSINAARKQGASDDQIIQEIARQNPAKGAVITEAKKKGADSSAILGEIARQNGGSLSAPATAPIQSQPVDDNPNNALFQSVAGENPLVAGAKAVGNLIPSVYNTAKGIGSAIMHPIDTAKGIYHVAGGAVNAALGNQTGSESDQAFDALKTLFKNRYGSLDALQKTATEDPFGFGTDVATLLTGGEGIAAKAGLIGKAAEGANVAAKTGSVIDKISEVTRVPKMVSSATTKLSDAVASGLQKSAMNLSDASKVKFGERVQHAVDYVTERKILGTPQRQLGVVEKDVANFENDIQPVLRQASKQGVKVSSQQMVNDLEDLKGAINDSRPSFEMDSNNPVERAAKNLRNESDTQAAINRIDREIKSLKGKGDIDVYNANERKRNYSQGKIKNDMFTPAEAVDKAIGDIYYKNVSSSLEKNGHRIRGKTLPDFNADYSRALNARDVLKLARTNPKMLARIISIGGGAVLGGTFFPGAGATAGAIGGAFNPQAQRVVQTGLNIGKTAGSAASKVAAKVAGKTVKAASVVVPAVNATRSSGSVEAYLKSIGL